MGIKVSDQSMISGWELVDAPTELSDPKRTQDFFFRKLVQLCSVNDVVLETTAVFKRSVNKPGQFIIENKKVFKNNSILAKVQELIVRRSYTKQQLALCKKLWIHLDLNTEETFNQKTAKKVVDRIAPYISDVSTVLRDKNKYEICFPFFKTANIETGAPLMSLIDAGCLVINQPILVNDEWELLTPDFAKRQIVEKPLFFPDSIWNSLVEESKKSLLVDDSRKALDDSVESVYQASLERVDSADSIAEMANGLPGLGSPGDRFPRIDSAGSIAMSCVGDLEDIFEVEEDSRSSSRSSASALEDNEEVFELEGFLRD